MNACCTRYASPLPTFRATDRGTHSQAQTSHKIELQQLPELFLGVEAGPRADGGVEWATFTRGWGAVYVFIFVYVVFSKRKQRNPWVAMDTVMLVRGHVSSKHKHGHAHGRW